MAGPVTADQAGAAPRRLCQRALESLSRGDDRKALAAFHSLLRSYPCTEWSAFALWEIYHIEDVGGNVSAAFSALQTLVERQPGHFEKAHAAQLSLIRKLLDTDGNRRTSLKPGRGISARDAESIRTMLKLVIGNGPESETGIRAHYLLGTVLEKAGLAKEAVALYEEFAEAHPAHELADDAACQAATIIFKMWRGMSNAAPALREKAALALADFSARYPDSDKASQVNFLLAQIRSSERQELIDLARYYEEQGNLKAAAVYRTQAKLKFPEE